MYEWNEYQSKGECMNESENTHHASCMWQIHKPNEWMNKSGDWINIY